MSDIADHPGGDDLRRRAEAQGRESSIQGPPLADHSLPSKVKRLVHELRVHQIELEMQNEELREAQERLQASQQRYFDLYDRAPVGYLTLSAEGLILEANLTAATLLGVTREALVKTPFTRIVFRDDQDVYYKHRLACNASRPVEAEAWTLPRACELRIVRTDGSSCWVELETAVANGPTGTTICRMTITDITARKHVEERLLASLHEKELLLREIHHRVKNNLQVVCSLLSLQSGQTPDPGAKSAFIASVDRVRSMAYAHENMYRAGDLTAINMEQHLQLLTSTLMRTYAAGPGIRCFIDAANTALGIDLAIPCGLIINELVTNALKHAFPNRTSGTILVAMRPQAAGRMQLMVRDDGIGIPDDIDLEHSQSMGMTIVSLLTDQLGGTVSRVSDGGTSFIIEFPTTPQ